MILAHSSAPLLALFSDFGSAGPYVGQVMAAWAAAAPGVPRVALFSESPAFDVEAGAHLLFAFTRTLPRGSVIEAVVDPGVGGPRGVAAVAADGLWFVAPDNGLLAVVVRRARRCAAWRVEWRPGAEIPQTFHGRDLFAPIAAALALGGEPPAPCATVDPPALLRGVADPAFRVILVDPYGNLMTGIRAAEVPPETRVGIGGEFLGVAPRFEACAAGEAFWYANADGLVEIAVNRGSAAARFGANVGGAVQLVLP